MKENDLVKRCFDAAGGKYDSIRLSTPCNKIFIIVGNKKQSIGQYVNEKGEKLNFTYTEETCVASGSTGQEAYNNFLSYLKLLNSETTIK